MVLRTAAVTIASKAYLSLARVTANSFLRHNPEIPFFLLLTDEVDGCFSPAAEPFHLLSIREVGLPYPERFLFQYAQQEASYAATPFAIDRLFSFGYDAVVFLKQETLVLDNLRPVLERLERHSALLTPHFLVPPSGGHDLRRELDVLRAGVFNGGFVAFSNAPESRAFLNWWKIRTSRNCFCAVEEGLHYEQRWLDFAPSLMPHALALRDPGMNVGHWNLRERDVRVRDDKVFACGEPCRVFRFSGYQPDAPEMVTKYNRHFEVAGTEQAAQVFESYQRQLMEAKWTQTRCWPYAYARFDNGLEIPSAVRRVFHDLGDGQSAFDNPFASSGSGSFLRWLESNHPQIVPALAGEIA